MGQLWDSYGTVVWRLFGGLTVFWDGYVTVVWRFLSFDVFDSHNSALTKARVHHHPRRHLKDRGQRDIHCERTQWSRMWRGILKKWSGSGSKSGWGFYRRGHTEVAYTEEESKNSPRNTSLRSFEIGHYGYGRGIYTVRWSCKSFICKYKRMR